MSSRKGWCGVRVSWEVPSTLLTIVTGLLCCSVMPSLRHLSQPCTKQQDGSFLTVLWCRAQGLAHTRPLFVYLVNEQIHRWIKAVTHPASRSHDKNIPYFIPAVLNPPYT